MAKQPNAWRKPVTEACAVVAKAVSQTSSGAAHTVQLMMLDPTFRATAMAEALERSKPPHIGGTDEHTENYRKVQKAADTLRGYDGKKL